MDVENTQRAPFTFFENMKLYKSVIFRFFFETFLMSPKDLSFNFVGYFATNWIFKKTKGSPFYNFENLRFLSLGYRADCKRSRLVFSRRILVENVPDSYSG